MIDHCKYIWYVWRQKGISATCFNMWSGLTRCSPMTAQIVREIVLTRVMVLLSLSSSSRHEPGTWAMHVCFPPHPFTASLLWASHHCHPSPSLPHHQLLPPPPPSHGNTAGYERHICFGSSLLLSFYCVLLFQLSLLEIIHAHRSEEQALLSVSSFEVGEQARTHQETFFPPGVASRRRPNSSIL